MTKSLKTFKTLVVDGESLLKTGFFGRKDLQNEGTGIGAIFHFLYTIRNFIREYNYNKVVVFWDHPNSGWFRIQHYPFYKFNRPERKLTEFDEYSLAYQRIRVKQYLEELFIRQTTESKCEADDLIAYYVKNTLDENKTIYTTDFDMLQLISKDTDVFLTKKRKFISTKNFYNEFGYSYRNVLLIKMLEGDKSDNVAGIENLGLRTILKKFPELKKYKKDTNFINKKCNKLLNESKNDKVINNLMEGKTKIGKFNDDYFSIMDKIFNLDNDMLTDNAKKTVNDIINLPLNPEGRSKETVIKMLMEDELTNLLPKSDNAFYNFIKPFLKIENKEVENYKKEINYG